MDRRKWYERMGVFGTAALLLIAGALKYPGEHSEAFIAVGFVVLGSWLTVEVSNIVLKSLAQVEHAEVVEDEKEKL